MFKRKKQVSHSTVSENESPLSSDTQLTASDEASSSESFQTEVSTETGVNCSESSSVSPETEDDSKNSNSFEGADISEQNSECDDISKQEISTESCSDRDTLEDAEKSKVAQEDLSTQLPVHEESLSAFDNNSVSVGDDEVSASSLNDSVPHAHSHKKELSPREIKSKRVRRILIVVIILLIAACAILPYLVVTHFQENQNEAVQQVLKQSETSPEKKDTKDATTAITKKTDVPDLMALMGKTKEEALANLGHGAFIAQDSGLKEPENPVVQQLSIPLTEEPADTRSGTPTVYLGLDKEHRIIQAGYAVATASLGFPPSSFADAVKNEGIIDKTLAEAGLKISPEAVKLPNDRMAYTHMSPDNKTIAEEKFTFEGDQDALGGRWHWSAVLSYNYTAANASGNLADTIRQITIFIKRIP